MSRSAFRTVLLYDAVGDPAAAAAVYQLQCMAYAGLTDPLWTIDVGTGPERRWRIQETSSAGVIERETLLDTLAGTGPAELAQVVTLATVTAANGTVVRTLAEDAMATVRALREYRPQGARVIDARFIAPAMLDEPTFLVALLTPHADANLMLIPEDRESDEHFGSPMIGARPEQFGGHVAAEVASQTGLWIGVGESPLSVTSAGVIGHRDTKVVLARSYARILIGPPVPLESAIADLSQLPVPSGREPALDPDRDVSVAAYRLIRSTVGMSHHAAPPYRSSATLHGTLDAFTRYLNEAWAYVRTVPQQLRAGVAADLDNVAADAFMAMAGDASSIRIARDRDGTVHLDRTIDRLVRAVEYEVDRLVAIPDPSQIAPDAWSSIVATLLAVADGSRLARADGLPRNHGRQAVVTQLEHLAPELAEDPGVVAAALVEYRSTGRHALAWIEDPDHLLDLGGGLDPAAEAQAHADSEADNSHPAADAAATQVPGAVSQPEGVTEFRAADGVQDDSDEADVVGVSTAVPTSATPSVLLGEFTDRLRVERENAERALQSHLAQLGDARRVLTRRESGLGSLAWLMGSLITALVTLLIIASNLPEAIGVDGWSRTTRTGLGVVLASVALGISLFAGAAVGLFRVRDGQRNRVGLRLFAILMCGVVAVLSARTDLLDGMLSGLRAAEVAFFGTVLLLVLFIARAETRLETPGGRGAARLTGSIALAYVAASIIGGVERRASWYQQLDAAERSRLFLVTVLVLLVAIAVVLMLIAQCRVAEQLRLREGVARLRWLVEMSKASARTVSSLQAAEHQAIGTATALARLFRLPFGHLRRVDDERPDEPNAFCEARKLQIHRFDLDERAQRLLAARIRHQLGSVGWLTRQYENAVRAFRPELALLHGADPEDLSEIRPEEDPAAGRFWAPEGLPKGVRWDFVRLLYSGRLDAALQAPLGELATDELLSGYIDRPGGRIDGSPSSIAEFAAPLACSRPPDLPFRLFAHQDLPVAGDQRTRLSSRLYWPTGAVRMPPGTVHGSVVKCSIHDAGSRGIIIPFARVDWSEAMALSQLPLLPHIERDETQVSDNDDDTPDAAFM